MADALNSLQYVRLAISESASVQEWQKDDVQAAYRLGEDTFDPADAAMGVKRFDLVRPPIPKAVGGGAQDPRTYNFRKMAIYVKGGRIIRVSEEIDFEKHIEITRAKREGKPKFLLDLLTRLRQGDTETPIKPRRMELVITFPKAAKVEIPIGLTSSLQGLFAPSPDEGSTEPESEGEPASDTESQPADPASPAA